jgi:hypothetical protein
MPPYTKASGVVTLATTEKLVGVVGCRRLSKVLDSRPESRGTII